MSINSRNAVGNGYRARRTALVGMIKDYESKKRFKAQKSLNWKRDHGYIKNATCSQCKRPMDSHMADKQKENKRENAPICMACIMGYKRKPLIKVFHERFKRNKLREEYKKSSSLLQGATEEKVYAYLEQTPKTSLVVELTDKLKELGYEIKKI